MNRHSYLERPLYSLTEAARLLQLAPSTLRFWLEGTRRGGHQYLPVLRPEPTGSSVLNWGEFVEAGYLKEYRTEIPLVRLRPLVEALRRELKTAHPLAMAQPMTSGKQLVRNLQSQLDLPEELWIVVGGDQLVLSTPAHEFFNKVEFDESSLEALQYTVMDAASPVIVDPRRAFGVPTIKGARAESIAELALAGEPPEEIVQIYQDFGLTVADVETAVRFEREFLGVAA